MSRLFTFGCSFTNFFWPTWADILGRQYDYYENWGQKGAGNLYIFNSINECIATNNITANDKIVVMWSSISREDRYINNQWITPGSIYSPNQTFYSKEFVKKCTDDRGYLIKDLAFVQSTKIMLDHLNIDYDFLSMVPFTWTQPEDDTKSIADVIISNIQDIQEIYKDTLDKIHPSAFEIIYKNDWGSRSWYSIDQEYQTLKKDYDAVAGADWPEFARFFANDIKHVPGHVLTDIQQPKWNWNLKRRQARRMDIHPIPSEHLEYLKNIYPRLELDQSTLDWIHYNDQIIISGANMHSIITNTDPSPVVTNRL